MLLSVASLHALFFVTYSIPTSFFFLLGFVFVRGGCNVSEDEDTYPQFHIIICTVFIFLSLFLALLSTLLALAFLSFYAFS